MAEKLQTRGAAFAPKTLDPDRRTVELVWTTGARVLRSGWSGQFLEELSLDPKHVRMGRLNNGAPFLADHSGSRVAETLGVVESAKLEGKRGTAVVRFPKEGISPEADRVFRLIQDGILQNVSVGYRIHKLEKTEESSEKLPVYRATDWEPLEISAVAIGADDGAGFRSAAHTSTVTENKMSGNTEMKPEGSVSEQLIADENERVAAVFASVRAAKLDDSIAQKLVAEGVTAQDARNTVIELLAARSNATATSSRINVDITDDGRDRFNRGATAWLIEKMGSTAVVERAKKSGANGFEKVELDPGEFRGHSLLDIAKDCLQRNGVRTRGMSKMQIATLATRSGGYASTSDFSTVLENALGKVLLASYATTADTWSLFCKVETVPDFRSSSRYRVGAFGTLPVVQENAEYQNQEIPDGESFSIATETRGGIIGISRQALVNDDMGAFNDLAQRLGRGAKLTIESQVYALLAQNSGLGPTMSNSQPFFHSSRSNVGTGSSLTVAGLDGDRQVLAQQMDPENQEYLDLRPKVLLVPMSLGGAARVLNEAQYDNDGTAFGKPNMVRGLFSAVVDSPRLSGTRRYLFADPSVAPAIVVCFLEGSGQAPYLESQEDFRRDGLSWKARIDVKAQVGDYRGAVTNAGTA